MNANTRNFVDSFKMEKKLFTVKDYMADNFKKPLVRFEKKLKADNHEVWRECSCGNVEDVKMMPVCSVCGNKIPV